MRDDLVYGDDVGMIERRGGERFPSEAKDALWVGGQVRRDALEGDPPLQARVQSHVDLAHAAGADAGKDLEGADALPDERLSGSFN